MPFRFSQVASGHSDLASRMIEDVRNAPIRGRDTQFRLAQQNILAYTFDESVPGWGPTGLNGMPFSDLVTQAIGNALAEGELHHGADFAVSSNATAKVTGDIYEVLTTAVLWNAAAAWNQYMVNGSWVSRPRYSKPTVAPSPSRQVAVLNLPRRYDWVRLLVPDARKRIDDIRAVLGEKDLAMPTSTPDMAIVVLPEAARQQHIWRTPISNLGRPAQTTIGKAHVALAGQIEPGEIVLAIALKTSLRSDRLYQPLYEANVMQFLLEGHLGAPQVEFEVHVLTSQGTGATDIYRAAALHSAGQQTAHRAVRELYQPGSASEVVGRFLGFLNQRMPSVG